MDACPLRRLRSWIRRRPVAFLVCVGALAWLSTGAWHLAKPLPRGLSFEGAWRPVSDATFLRDVTWMNEQGSREMDAQIFDRMLEMASGTVGKGDLGRA